MKDPKHRSLPEEEEEHVAPHRAAQRLYDEMALAYHDQVDLDREMAEAFLPASVESLPPEEE